MKPCPICRNNLNSYALKGVELDLYKGKYFSYQKCPTCDVIVLSDEVEKNPIKIDYSQSGYYSPQKPRLTPVIEFIGNLFAKHQVSLTQKALGVVSLDQKKILDIGCGKGRFLATVKNEGGLVKGLEPTIRSFTEAKNLLGDDIQCEMMAEGLFDHDYFDAITMWHVFEHIQEPVFMLRLCQNALKPSGKLIIAIPNTQGLMAIFGGDKWFNLDPPRHVIHYNPASISNLLIKNGYAITHIDYHYPELTVISILQTLMNKLPITGNFLFNFLKRNKDGLPDNIWVFSKDMLLTLSIGIFIGPFAILLAMLLSELKMSDCITVIAQK